MVTEKEASEIKAMKAALDEIVELPIAAKLKAEPGWRAVLFVTKNDNVEENLRTVYVVVQFVKHWALEAPTIVPEKPADMLTMRAMSLFGGAMPTLPWKLWPIDVQTGKRLGRTLHRLVPPSDQTDEQLIEEAKLWCAELIEKNKPSEPTQP